MATESFGKTFKVNRGSVDSMIRIISSKKQTVLNQKKTCVQLNRNEIRKLFGNSRT